MDKQTKKEFNSLARMIKTGFDATDKKVDKRFDKVEMRLENLEKGQEDIKLKLDNVPYRFELKELEKRVDELEVLAGLAKQ